MPTKLSRIETIVRGVIIDQLEEGESPLFSESDVVSAANIVKGDLWGTRPEAFVTSALTVIPPSDLESTRAGLEFTYGETSATLAFLQPELISGIIEIIFKSNQKGTLFSLGDGGNYITAEVTDSGIDVETYTSSSATTTSLSLPGSFLDGRYHTISVTADLTDLTVASNDDSASTAYTGVLTRPMDGSYLGYASTSGTEVYFDGVISSFKVTSLAGFTYYELDFANSSGYTIIELINGTPADIFGPSVVWVSDDELAINEWALQLYCYGVAAFLLRQRGKDSFYRKAADTLHKMYVEG